jgi:hypothetical protein
MFDHHKCTTTKVQVLAKQDMLICPPRHPKYSATFWNCQRPYMRCTCEQDAKSGCKGTMLWFDQAMWFLVNNLERFFDSAYGNSLAAKFGAFITWLNGAARLVVRAQITFMVTRRMMQEAALEATVNPTGKLLASYYEALGARQVERLIRNAQFSLDTAPSPSPTTNKRRKFNPSGETAPHGYLQPQMRPVPRGGQTHGAGRRGRGGYNKNFRPNLNNQCRLHDFDNRRPANPKRQRDHEHTVVQAPGLSPPQMLQLAVNKSHVTPPSTSGSSSVPIKPWSPIKDRVLEWTDL